MTLTQWLYVGRSCECDDCDHDRVTDRDVWPGVTGMMVRADDWRAEWLEGPSDEIATLRAQTIADPELAEVITVVEGPMPARRFDSWSLAYEGRAVGIEQIITRAATGAVGGREGLLAMLHEFSPEANEDCRRSRA
jgi:hypothetical protein